MQRIRPSIVLAVTTMAVLAAAPRTAAFRAQATRLEYRVVYAQARSLESALNDAGRDGFACAVVARTEPGFGAPGVAVIATRVAGAPIAPVPHHVFVGGGGELGEPLTRAGADGDRLCGLTFIEDSSRPAVVAVTRRDTDPSARWQYSLDVLRDFKPALARINDAARAGARPVATAQVNDNRVPAMRSWVVAMERPAAGALPGEVVVRSAPGPDGLTKALNEQGRQGYEANLFWREGETVVAMMTRAPGGPTTFEYLAESRAPSAFHFTNGLYLADFPYLSDGDRLVVTNRRVSGSAEIVADPLPPLGGAGVPRIGTLLPLGDHLTSFHNAVPVSALILRAGTGPFVLRTVVAERR